MLIYWNKRKHLHEKRVPLPEDFLGTPTWPPFHCFGTPIWSLWRHVKTLYMFGPFASRYKLQQLCFYLWCSRLPPFKTIFLYQVGLATAFDLAAFRLSMIVPVKKSVNHSRTVASMRETGWEKQQEAHRRSDSTRFYNSSPVGHCFLSTLL